MQKTDYRRPGTMCAVFLHSMDRMQKDVIRIGGFAKKKGAQMTGNLRKEHMNLRKTFASLMAAGLTAAAATIPAAAATDGYQSIIDPEADCSLTIYKLKTTSSTVREGTGLPDSTVTEEGMKGIVFSTKKVASYVTVTDNGTVQTLFTNVDTGFLQLLSDHGVTVAPVTIGGQDYYTPVQLSDALDAMNCVTGTTPGEVLINNWMKTEGTALPATDDDGMTYLDIAAENQGLYLVSETDYSAYSAAEGALAEEVVYKPSSPFLAAVPMTGPAVYDDGETYADAASYWIYNVTVYPKNQTVSVPKYIVSPQDQDTLEQSEDLEIGTPAEELITASAPAVSGASNAYEKYVITDTMDEGISFVELLSVKIGTEIANADSKSDFSSFTELTKDTDYTLTQNEADNSFAITFLAAGLSRLNALTDNAQVVVDFKVMLNEDAEDGSGEANENTPKLTWKNLSTLETSTEGNKPKLYSYRIDLTKTGVEDASNVAFTIRQGTSYMDFAEDADGSYHVFTSEDDDSEKVQEISPASDGTLLIRGLDEGVFMFEETKTESGHDLLSTRFTVTLNGADPADGTLVSAQLTAVDADGNAVSDPVEAAVSSGTASITVSNNESVVLHTGGSGTYAVYACGVLVIGAAVLLMLNNRKHTAE